ncbi:MAG: hypothetical protein Q7T32_06530 [Moraxellaceae bacterium]|nr:hypothetical protein [Moraxellaceae bacterium]
MNTRFSRLLHRPLALLLTLLIITPAAFATSPTPNTASKAVPKAAPKPAEASVAEPVLYDRQQDTLSIQTKDHALSDILLRVSRQTGMEVRMDPKVERKITMTLKAQPIERSLDRLLAQLSVLKQFKTEGKGKNQKDILVSITVLPEGQRDASSAQRLMQSDAELAYRAGVMSQYDKRAGVRSDILNDQMVDRWKAREKTLTAKEKARYDKLKADMDKRTAAQEKKRAEQKAGHDAREAAHAERQKERPGYAERATKKKDPALIEKARLEFAQPESDPVIGE